MKKFLLCAALIAMAASASAQDKVVKKARSLQEEVRALVANANRNEKQEEELNTKLTQALEMIEPTLTSPETVKELANAWDVKAQLSMFVFNPELNKFGAKQPFDTLKFENYLKASMDAMEECYKVEKAAGKFKYSSRKKEEGEGDDNLTMIQRLRNYWAFLGQGYAQTQNHKKSAESFKNWLDFPEVYTILEINPELKGQLKADQLTPQIAFFCALSAYNAHDVAMCAKYIEQAEGYTEQADAVEQLRLTSYMASGDTVKWAAEARKSAVAHPENEAIVQNLLFYYFNKEKTQEATAFADELLAADPNNKWANYTKGLVLMNGNKYLEAIEFFDKAAEIDPSFSDAVYNAGVCYSNYGYDLNEKLSGKKMTAAQNKAEIEKVKEQYAKAEPYFLKVRELEPDNAHKWASRLRTVYYILGNKAKEAEMGKLLGE